jgi:hypothetical protein
MRTTWVTGGPVPRIDADQPLWASDLAGNAYPHTATLTARNGPTLMGVWIVPLRFHGQSIHVEREARTLPYCSPYIAAKHPQRRRDIMEAMLEEVLAHAATVSLPMSPGFYDVTMAGHVGLGVDWRHTHEIELTSDARWRQAYAAKVRNHIAFARRHVSLATERHGEGFDFERGLVAQTAHQVTIRRDFIHSLPHRGGSVICCTALAKGKPVGQALVVCDLSIAYLFHSWFDRTGPRGVPSLLIDSVAERARDVGRCRVLDLEGSVIESVDYYMSGFGGAITPYPMLQLGAVPDTQSAPAALGVRPRERRLPV